MESATTGSRLEPESQLVRARDESTLDGTQRGLLDTPTTSTTSLGRAGLTPLRDREVPIATSNDSERVSTADASPDTEAPRARPSDPTLHVLPAPEAPFTIPGLARYELLERLVNVLVASVALVLAAPLMVVIAMVVRLTSKGPVVYKQPRIGIDRRGVRVHSRRRGDRRWHLWANFLALHDDQRDRDLGGSAFMIYKFRTMCVDAECSTGAVWAVRNDPRSTRIGAFLRKYRLDELPQLVNVLKGDMNIVGPRPERPSIFARLCEQIDDYPLRQRTKPGITGWAQIHLMYDSCIEDVRKKVRYDLEYLREKSVLRDLKIMAKTLPSVLFKRRGW